VQNTGSNNASPAGWAHGKLGPKIQKHRQIPDNGDQKKPPDKAIFFLLFLANKFQPAWKNAATSTISRAGPLIIRKLLVIGYWLLVIGLKGIKPNSISHRPPDF
jgi:hypothetical protein